MKGSLYEPRSQRCNGDVVHYVGHRGHYAHAYSVVHYARSQDSQ